MARRLRRKCGLAQYRRRFKDATQARPFRWVLTVGTKGVYYSRRRYRPETQRLT